jgi:hypothetical protein
VRVQAADEARILELAAALALAADHRDDLPAATDQLTEHPCGLVRQGPRLRPHGLGEAGDGSGVQPVGLGEPAGGAGEIADLARIDDRQGQAGGAERGSDGRLEAAGGLEHDQPRREPRQALGQGR